MLNLYNWDNFILEKYGYNKTGKNISKKILQKINENFGKLLLNGEISINNTLGEIDDILFIDDIINVKISERNYGFVVPQKIINRDGQIKDMVLNLEFVLSREEQKSKYIFDTNKIIDTIQHEVLHIIERYLTYNNGKSYSESWEQSNRLIDMNRKYESKEWSDISYFIYLSLPHEIRAKLQQLNSQVERLNKKGTLYVNGYIKSTEIYKTIYFLSELDSDVLIDKLKKCGYYEELIKDFSVLFLQNNKTNYEKNFKEYIDSLKRKNKKLLDKLLKISYNFESYSFEDRIIDYDEYKKRTY